MSLTRENNAAKVACPAQQCHPAGVGDQQGLLPCAPLVANRRRGRSVAFVHALLVVGPLSSFPQINILAAAVSHVSLNSSWQQ